MPAHYIIFHKDRQKINANVQVLRDHFIYEEDRFIYVDKLKNGSSNEDPYIFSNPWLYSYCWTQKLRQEPKDPYVQPGSYLIFADYTQKGILLIDTVLFVNHVLVWPQPGVKPPVKYFNQNSAVWIRHFRHGITPGEHVGKYTYEAEMYKNNKNTFSYLPLNKDNRASINLETLDENDLIEKIKKKISEKRKPPVLLNEKEVQIIINRININLTDKIIEIIGVNEICNYIGQDIKTSCA